MGFSFPVLVTIPVVTTEPVEESKGVIGGFEDDETAEGMEGKCCEG